MSNFNLEDLNMIDITAKRVPEAFTEFKGELVKGEEIHKKTGLTLNDIDLVVEVLEKSLVIEIPNVFQRLPPYNFYAIEITVFGRQVLEKYKEQLQRVLQNPLYWRIGFSNQTKCQQTSR